MLRCADSAVVVVVLSTIMTGTHGWGTDGHEIVADIAAALLSPAALNASQAMAKGSLADVANWADQVHRESEWSWSAPLHFLNVQKDCPVGKTCAYERTRDCKDHRSPDFPFCVPAAVQNYTKQIPAAATEYPIRFLVHFMGDLHQPLHCALASDYGGNTIKVTFDVPNQGTKWDLHQVWDFGIIVRYINQSCAGDQKRFTKQLLSALSASEKKAYTKPCKSGDSLGLSCPDTWAQGSFDNAMLHAYIDTDTGKKVVSGTTLSDEYFTKNLPIVKLQLVKAGVRLAAILEGAFGKQELQLSELHQEHLSGNARAPCHGGKRCGRQSKY